MSATEPRIVRNKSIPNVDSDRLRTDIGRIHQMVHTPEGLHAWDAPRRGLYDFGRKALMIRGELEARGEQSAIDCRWCGTQS